MKKAFYCFIFTPAFLLCLVTAVNAQSAKTDQTTLKAPAGAIAVDGSLKDWGDTLRYFNDEKKIGYTLANDKTMLYAVVRISDRINQMRILNAGITLGIDTKGKKKESFSLTFPLADPGAPPEFGKRSNQDGEITKEDRDELMRERVTKLRNIKVEGFKDIEGDMITTSNTYGIKAAIDYDAEGNLVYEIAIPLQFFHTDDITKNEWAFNFKINGIQRPKGEGAENPDHQSGGFGGGGRGGRGGGGMGGGRGGRGGRGGGGFGGSQAGRSEISQSVDFWEKFYLAK
ncbi:hypothetical protein SNE25_29600 [Mucilaginibacter sabulilitoris]|uniref:Uncharacterized protein n=1 Tax=Mucilaginibacter sabulilitoris TaxID=1173583 RepID=A0ABZ0TQQ7_9SPHI|nr:hypothetical protein [Mucilaginibacter sabulilitoris]WPU93475.1 hypothetical protein SNE25_29600 [Mucilaginibacter sabulilitoris]